MSEKQTWPFTVHRTRKPKDAGEGTRLAALDEDGIMQPIRQPSESDEQWQAALAVVKKQQEETRSFRLDLVNTPGELLKYCRTLLQSMERDAHQADLRQMAESLVRAIWLRLDHLKLSHLAPEEPEAIKSLIHARRAIRDIMSWCEQEEDATEAQGEEWQALRARLKKRFPRWRCLDRDLYFYRLRRVDGLRAGKIRDRCRKEHPEWKLPDETAGREVVDTALKRTARNIQQSGLSA